MIVMILYRLEGEPAAAAESAFTDVRSGCPVCRAIGWAAGSGIVNGVGGGRFDPNGLATREQTAAILYRYARFKGCDLMPAATCRRLRTRAACPLFALAPMTWAVGERLISGNAIGGRTLLDPQGVTTRAQFAMIMMRHILNVVQLAVRAPGQPLQQRRQSGIPEWFFRLMFFAAVRQKSRKSLPDS